MEQTDPRMLLVNVARIFEQLKIPYLITGGMAVLVWGRPRFTADIDIAIEIKPSNIKDLVKAFKDLSNAGYIDEEVAGDVALKGGEFNFIDGVTGVKVDFWVTHNDKFEISRFQRKVAKKILNQEVYFTSPEDLILSKLKWYRESGSDRHLEDVQSVLTISGENLDMDYIKKWAKQLQIENILRKLL